MDYFQHNGSSKYLETRFDNHNNITHHHNLINMDDEVKLDPSRLISSTTIPDNKYLVSSQGINNDGFDVLDTSTIVAPLGGKSRQF